MIAVFCAALFVSSVPVSAEETNTSSVTGTYIIEPYLYPAGFPSADTLRKGEKFIAANGWGSYGITDRLTLTIDWLLILAGVPAGYVRYKLPFKSKRISHAVEVYGLSLFRFDEEINNIDDIDEFNIWQRGWQGWLHWNTTYRFAQRWRLHASVGATYDTYQRYQVKEDSDFPEDLIYTNYTYFDYGAGFDYSPRRWFRFAANYINGNNFYIFDQNPQKWIIQTSLQFSPFLNWKHGFFKNMRIELIGFYVKFPKLNYDAGFPPLFPLFMWQW